MAQRWPAPKPKLAQAEFDEAVKTNIEDFDMTPDEAVKSAVEEFTVQGYDLSGVFKSADGTNIEEQPLAIASRSLEAALGDTSTSTSTSNAAPLDVESVNKALEALFAALNESDDKERVQELLAVALKVSSLKAVLAAVARLSAGTAPDADLGAVQPLLLAASIAKQLLLGSLEIRDGFDACEGHELLVKMLAVHAGASPAQRAVQAAVAGLGEAAALKEEMNKEKLMVAGFGLALLGLLPGDSAPAEEQDLPLDLVINVSGALRALVTADDDRPQGSGAFRNARKLAGKHQALTLLLRVLQRVGVASPEGSVALLLAVKALAANEEICKDFTDNGGLLTLLDVLKRWLAHREVAKSCAGAMRQLANSDPVKRFLAEHGGVGALLGALGEHAGCEDVLEPVLGVLVNMTLRQPEVVAQLAEAGAVDALLGVMTSMAGSSPVQRQCCMLLRNMVVRNAELRPVFLEQGAEALVRAAKKAHPKTCADVGAAALRDLGLDNYND